MSSLKVEALRRAENPALVTQQQSPFGKKKKKRQQNVNKKEKKNE